MSMVLLGATSVENKKTWVENHLKRAFSDK